MSPSRSTLASIFVLTSLNMGCQSENALGALTVDLLSDHELVDMTHTVSMTAPFWAGDSTPFVYEAVASHPSGKTIMGRYSVPEHFGTHLDAPIHGGDHLPTVDELTAEDLFGPAVVVDISEQAAQDPDYLLSVKDLEDWEDINGEIPAGAVVLLNTGWGSKWDDVTAYKNADQDGRMHFPGFSEESAHFLIDTRSIRGVGIDNMSIDYGMSRDFVAHGIINGSGIYHLENVANVDLLPAVGAFLIVAPIKLEGGSGGQVRIWAVLP